MRRVVIVMSLLMVLGCWAVRSRPARAEDIPTTLIPQASLDQIYNKLDEIAKRQTDDKAVSQQLARILKNQEAMMAELYIIKIRTSRR